MHVTADLELERRAPPAETIRFRFAPHHLRALRIATGGALLLFAFVVWAGAPAIVSLFFLAAAVVAGVMLLDAMRRVALRPEHIEIAPEGFGLVHETRAPVLIAWTDVARLEHDHKRRRILLTSADAQVVELDDGVEDLAFMLDAATLHIDAVRRSDAAAHIFARTPRPVTCVRSPWPEIAALAFTAAGLVLGLLARPAAFMIAAFGAPTLIWRWMTVPNRVIVDDSAVWIVRRFSRDVIPLRAIRDVAFGMDGRPVAPAVIIDHRERGYIVLDGFGGDALPLFDAVMAALAAQRARASVGKGSASHANAYVVGGRAAVTTLRTRLMSGGAVAAALVAVTWLTMLTGVPLRTAVEYGNDTVLRVALLMGAPRNAADGQGLTALHYAALHDRPAMVERLVRSGAAIDPRSTPNAYTPLHKAAEVGSVRAAQALIAAGADVHARSARGRTPLAHAMSMRAAPDTALAAVLLNARSNTNAVDNGGRTALHHAGSNAHVAWIPLLRRAGASTEVHDTAGYTPLHVAARAGDVRAVSALLDAGADIDARGWRGRTAIAAAAHRTDTPAPLIDLLLAAGARVDIEDDAGWNAVQLAASVNNAAALELFARRRAPMDATSGLVPPALHIAIRRHNTEAVRALLRGGASPSRPFNRTTAYDVANQTGNPTISAHVRMR